MSTKGMSTTEMSTTGMIGNIYLIRHAKTRANLERRYKGSADEPLSEEGIRELNARITRGYYPPAERIYVSPMLRCRQTAGLIYPDTPLKIVPGFAEYHFGEFEGKTYEELKDDPAYRKWIDSGGRVKAPGGEDIEEYKRRCCQAFARVLEEIKKDPVRDTAMVIHGGTIMAIMERYVPGEKSFYDWQIANCEGYKLMMEEHRSIRSVRLLG